MARYRQVNDATPTGYTGGLCQKFVEDCYGVQYKFTSALACWNVQKNAGVAILNERPALGMTVPIFFDGLSGWASPYAHVAVRDDAGYVWSSTLEGYHQAPYYHPDIDDLLRVYRNGGHPNIHYIGWTKELGEKVIVEEIRDPAPTPTPTPEDDSYRVVGFPAGVAVRSEPSSDAPFAPGYTYLDKGVKLKMQGWCIGQKINGENRWFVTRSGFYMWFGGFDEKEKTLPHLTQFDKKYEDAETTPPPVVDPERPPEGDLVTKLIEVTDRLDFVTKRVPVLACNLFPERKFLKDSYGNLLESIQLANDWEVLVSAVKSVDRENQEIEYIVIHNPANGGIQETINEFQKPVNKSAHLIVDNEQVVQMVDFKDTAFAVGDNMKNAKSINIEFQDGIEIDRYVEIIAEIKKIYKNASIVSHRQLSATACPGTLTDEQVKEIIDKVNDKLNDKPTDPEEPEGNDDQKEDEKENTKVPYTEEQKKQADAKSKEVKDVIDNVASSEIAQDIQSKTPQWARVSAYIIGDLLLTIGLVANDIGIMLNAPDPFTFWNSVATISAKAGATLLVFFGIYKS